MHVDLDLVFRVVKIVHILKPPCNVLLLYFIYFVTIILVQSEDSTEDETCHAHFCNW